MKHSENNTDTAESIFRILVTSDTHLGVNENNPVTSQDCFRTFEEVLQIANDKNVDFMLHAGDLFHEHRPSKETLIKTGDILARNVLGERELSYKIAKTVEVNTRDERIRVKMPIFMIHGDHDDPGGMENMSNIEIMKSTRLLNYIGKIDKLEHIELEPVLFQKGKTRIALFSLGYMKNERFNLGFEKKMIKFKRPEGEWFNILMIHQEASVNSSKRSGVNPKLLPDFFQLVLWGHEHECVPCPQPIAQGTHILYMGSTVAVSMVESESKRKHCFVLEVQDTKFRVTPVPLRTVRPFLHAQLELSLCPIKRGDDAEIQQIIENKILSLLEQLDYSHAETNEMQEAPLLPLLRLKVEYSGYSVITSHSLSKKFEGKIANPQKDFLKFYKKTNTTYSKAERNQKRKELREANFHREDLLKEIEDPSKAQLDVIV